MSNLELHPNHHHNPRVNATRSFQSALPWVLLAALAGCASTAPQPETSRPVRVCAADQCSEAGQQYSTSQMLHALNRLFEANDGAGMRFCRADPQTRTCTADDVGYFVLGGIIPGRGSSSSGKVSRVELDAANQSIRYQMTMNLRFLGIPLYCADHDAVLVVKSESDVAMTDSNYFCTWLAVGMMTASFGYVIDTIDFDKGQLSGYWRHGVTGTGNGRGHGYSVITFPHPMPRGENWLAQN